MVRFIIYIAAVGGLFLLDQAIKRSTDRMVDSYVRNMKKDREE